MHRFARPVLAALIGLASALGATPVVRAADLGASIPNHSGVCARALGARHDHQPVPASGAQRAEPAQRRHHRFPETSTSTATCRRSEDRPIGRTYCGATVILSDGDGRDIWYLIEEGQGYASIGNNVEFCVSGFDRWYVYNGALPGPALTVTDDASSGMAARACRWTVLCRPAARKLKNRRPPTQSCRRRSPRARTAWSRHGIVSSHRRGLRLLRAVAVLVAELLRGGRAGGEPPAMRDGAALRLRRPRPVAAIRARLPRKLPDRRARRAERDAAHALRHHAVGRPHPPSVAQARLLLRARSGRLFRRAARCPRDGQHSRRNSAVSTPTRRSILTPPRRPS